MIGASGTTGMNVTRFRGGSSSPFGRTSTCGRVGRSANVPNVRSGHGGRKCPPPRLIRAADSIAANLSKSRRAVIQDPESRLACQANSYLHPTIGKSAFDPLRTKSAREYASVRRGSRMILLIALLCGWTALCARAMLRHQMLIWAALCLTLLCFASVIWLVFSGFPVSDPRDDPFGLTSGTRSAVMLVFIWMCFVTAATGILSMILVTLNSASSRRRES